MKMFTKATNAKKPHQTAAAADTDSQSRKCSFLSREQVKFHCKCASEYTLEVVLIKVTLG